MPDDGDLGPALQVLARRKRTPAPGHAARPYSGAKGRWGSLLWGQGQVRDATLWQRAGEGHYSGAKDRWGTLLWGYGQVRDTTLDQGQVRDTTLGLRAGEGHYPGAKSRWWTLFWGKELARDTTLGPRAVEGHYYNAKSIERHYCWAHSCGSMESEGQYPGTKDRWWTLIWGQRLVGA